MQIRIEDEVEDVINKAQSGLGISDGDLSELTGVDRGIIRDLRKGKFNADAARAIAPHLRLAPSALVSLGQHDWQPEEIHLDGLYSDNTPFPLPGYEEMTVNAYLVVDPSTGEAAAFDTGASAKGLIKTLQGKAQKLSYIFLTHTHNDHIADLEELTSHLAPGGKVFVHPNEAIAGADTLSEGQGFNLSSLTVTAHETSGHSPGSTSYLIEGLERPVAIVGDAIFCASIGGVRGDYLRTLKLIREHILGLPGNTIICAGHGPLTTVENELNHNPFFAAQS